MKKSTILIIFIIYLASIVVIGFFGMKIKVYDEIKYVKEINMQATAENEQMFNFVADGIDASTGNKKYILTVYFDYNIIRPIERNNGLIVNRECVPITLIPHVTYDTGDVANSEEESIKFSLSDATYEKREFVSLSERGLLMCFERDLAFRIYIDPATKSGNGTGVIISVFVV